MTIQRIALLAMSFVSVAVCLSGCDAELALGAASSESQAEKQGSTTSGSANPSPATPSAETKIDLATIADKLEERYRNAKFLHLEGRTTTSTGHDLQYVHDTSQDSLRTVCRSGEEIVSAFSLHNGRVQEFVPKHPKRLLLEYDSEDDLQIPNLVYGDDERHCLNPGFAIRIGPDPIHRQWLYVDRIREGRLKGQEKVGDSLCHVIEWSTVGSGGKDAQVVMTWTNWVDVADFTVRRQHTIQSITREGQLPRREERDFLFHVVRLLDEAPPDPFDWSVKSIAENAPKPKPEEGPSPEPDRDELF